MFEIFFYAENCAGTNKMLDGRWTLCILLTHNLCSNLVLLFGAIEPPVVGNRAPLCHFDIINLKAYMHRDLVGDIFVLINNGVFNCGDKILSEHCDREHSFLGCYNCTNVFILFVSF